MIIKLLFIYLFNYSLHSTLFSISPRCTAKWPESHKHQSGFPCCLKYPPGLIQSFSLIFFPLKPYWLFYPYLKYNYCQLFWIVVQRSYPILLLTKSYPTVLYYILLYQPLLHEVGIAGIMYAGPI